MTEPTRPINLIGPLDYLFDERIPVQRRVLMVVAAYAALDTGTLSRIFQRSRPQIQEATKALARRGEVTRRNGMVRIVPEAMPDVPEASLSVLRAVHGKHKRPGIPTPLKRRLLARQEAGIESIPYKFTEATARWLDERGAFAEPSFWAKQIGKRIAESARLCRFDSSIRSVAARKNDDLDDIGSSVLLVLHVVECARAAGARNPCGMIQTILADMAERRARDTDLNVHLLLKSLKAEPYADRPPVSAYLRAAQQHERGLVPGDGPSHIENHDQDQGD
jgi:hypothetical protein